MKWFWLVIDYIDIIYDESYLVCESLYNRIQVTTYVVGDRDDDREFDQDIRQ